MLFEKKRSNSDSFKIELTGSWIGNGNIKMCEIVFVLGLMIFIVVLCKVFDLIDTKLRMN